MKITFNGYYGFASYGDELFNLAAALGARRWWSDHQASILGPPVAGVEGKFRVPGWFPPSLYTSPGLGGKLSRLGFFAGAMLGSDLIVYAGGSTLTSGRTIRKKIERFAAERGITKFAAIGVSVGPFSDAGDEADAARLLRKFIHFSVRDRRSAELLEKMGVPVKPMLGRDLAGVLPLLLPENAQPAAKGTVRPVLGVSVCHFERHFGGDTSLEERRNAALAEGVARFAKREGVLVRIFCLNTNPLSGDDALSGEMQRSLQRAGVAVEMVSAQDNLLGCWHGLGACDAVLSVRLHGAITAYLCGVPFSLVEYHRKCADLVEDIGQPEALRIRPDCTDPLAVEQIVARLFRESELPALSRDDYAREAARNFTQVPWATAAG